MFDQRWYHDKYHRLAITATYFEEEYLGMVGRKGGTKLYAVILQIRLNLKIFAAIFVSMPFLL